MLCHLLGKDAHQRGTIRQVFERLLPEEEYGQRDTPQEGLQVPRPRYRCC
ncbi:MAG: hypothetical protein R3E95_10255 [Thiolinea sp.]